MAMNTDRNFGTRASNRPQRHVHSQTPSEMDIHQRSSFIDMTPALFDQVPCEFPALGRWQQKPWHHVGAFTSSALQHLGAPFRLKNLQTAPVRSRKHPNITYPLLTGRFWPGGYQRF